jgi:CO/xanthine dehydrogenase FAD-binding subunit
VRWGPCSPVSAPFPSKVARAAAELLRGRRLEESLIAQAVEAALTGARALRRNPYKVDLAKALVRRALASIAGKT